MGVEVRMAGAAGLDKVVHDLRRLGNRGLGQQMAKGFRAATNPLRKDITAEVPKAMPSGYAPALAKSLRFRQSVQSGRTTARVLLRVHADGQRERRDLPALNQGILRHPVYGNRNRWVAQRVRRGVVDRPVDRLGPEIRRQMDAVVAYVADQLKG